MPLFFDKEEKEVLKKIDSCYSDLLSCIEMYGGHLQRAHINYMEKTHNSEAFWGVASLIKQTIDEQNIISPNKYSKPTK
jgi:hypothetical protein